MNPLYPAVAVRADFRCEYCHAPEQVFNFTFDVEHIQPRSAEGDDSMDNLALACESCNLFKSNIVAVEDEIERRQVPLFHPRRDLWEQHFLFDSEEAIVQGLTAIGRATVTQLRFNSSFQVRARRQWMRLNLYP